jgi:hypothetical protein
MSLVIEAGSDWNYIFFLRPILPALHFAGWGVRGCVYSVVRLCVAGKTTEKKKKKKKKKKKQRRRHIRVLVNHEHRTKFGVQFGFFYLLACWPWWYSIKN